MSNPKCNHIDRVKVPDYPDIDAEDQSPTWSWEERSTMEDIDTGRMRCTMCGEIEYYTGAWKDFWEKGIPCLGSAKYKAQREREINGRTAESV